MSHDISTAGQLEHQVKITGWLLGTLIDGCPSQSICAKPVKNLGDLPPCTQRTGFLHHSLDNIYGLMRLPQRSTSTQHVREKILGQVSIQKSGSVSFQAVSGELRSPSDLDEPQQAQMVASLCGEHAGDVVEAHGLWSLHLTGHASGSALRLQRPPMPESTMTRMLSLTETRRPTPRPSWSRPFEYQRCCSLTTC